MKHLLILLSSFFVSTLHGQNHSYLKHFPSASKIAESINSENAQESYIMKMSALNTAWEFVRKMAIAEKRFFTTGLTGEEKKLMDSYNNAKNALWTERTKTLSQDEKKEINRQVSLHSSSNKMQYLVGQLLPADLKQKLNVPDKMPGSSPTLVQQKQYPSITGWWHINSTPADNRELYLGENGKGKYDGEDMTYQIDKNLLRIQNKTTVYIYMIDYKEKSIGLKTGDIKNPVYYEFLKGRNPSFDSAALFKRTKSSSLCGTWMSQDFFLVMLIITDDGRVLLSDPNNSLRRGNPLLQFSLNKLDGFSVTHNELKLGNGAKLRYSVDPSDSILMLKTFDENFTFTRPAAKNLGIADERFLGRWHEPFVETYSPPLKTNVMLQCDYYWEFLSNGKLLMYEKRKIDGETIFTTTGWWGVKNNKLTYMFDTESNSLPAFSKKSFDFDINHQQLRFLNKDQNGAIHEIAKVNFIEKVAPIPNYESPLSHAALSGKTSISKEELCLYFPLKSKMTYNYTESGGILKNLFSALSNTKNTLYTNVTFTYTATGSKQVKGKTYKAYKINSTDVNFNNKIFYYYCGNGIVASHNERYDAYNDYEGMEYNWVNNQYHHVYSSGVEASGEFTNWTLLKADVKTGESWEEEQSAGSYMVMNKTTLEDMNLTITVNGKEYKNVIILRKEIGQKGAPAMVIQTEYYAKGIGKIKQIDATSMGERTLELVSYSFQ